MPKTAQKKSEPQERPLSPHLQVYKPQLTTILSITHRMTGVGLAVATLALVYWLWALAMGPSSYETAITVFQSFLGKTILFLASLGFSYHLANGVRHLMWDVGFGYSLPTVYKSGWTVVVLTVLFTLWVWF